MAVSATVKASISARHTRSIDLGTGTSDLSAAISQAFTDGVGAGQVNLVFSDQRTLSASATENLDLAGGSLTDIYGTALTFARIKAVIVKAATGNTNDVQVTRPASNGVPIFMAAGDGIALAPGAAFLWMAPTAAGVVVTASTGDLLTITNSAGSTSVTYDILILGAAS